MRLLCYLHNDDHSPAAHETLSVAQRRMRFMRAVEELSRPDIWKRGLSEDEMVVFLTCFLSILDNLTVVRDDVPVLHETFAKILSEVQCVEYVSSIKTVLINAFLMLTGKEHSSGLAVFQHLSNYCARFSTSPHPTITFDQAMKWVDKWSAAGKDIIAVLIAMDRMYELAGLSTESLACQLKLLKQPRFASNRGDQRVCRAIFHSIRKPNVYLFDDLLSIDAIKKVEGEPSFELLCIFTFGNLAQYNSFWKKMQSNDRFLAMFKEYGLTHETCTEKMKMLTFVQLCESNDEIKYDVIVNALDLESEDCIEPFVINAVKAKLVECLIDVANKRILVNNSVDRLFKVNNWNHVMERIKSWDGNVANIGAQTI
uniref:Eukaryotic translation initiation factor 3 subunit M, putative n=1 Tax=Fundulus heteroclitus TaxID=8078 RepID=A0A146UMB8_FUNHE